VIHEPSTLNYDAMMAIMMMMINIKIIMLNILLLLSYCHYGGLGMYREWKKKEFPKEYYV
jgi:hypothetical protein